MPYDTKDMVRLAQHIFGSTTTGCQDETRWRAAIARCYYACYLTARDQLWGVDGRPSSAQERNLPRPKNRRLGAHELTLEGLGANPSVTSLAKRKRQKDKLGSLKALRTAADYRSDDSHPEVQKLFKQYNVKSWDRLAEQAFTLTTDVLPELATVPRFR